MFSLMLVKWLSRRARKIVPLSARLSPNEQHKHDVFVPRNDATSNVDVIRVY